MSEHEGMMEDVYATAGMSEGARLQHDEIADAVSTADFTAMLGANSPEPSGSSDVAESVYGAEFTESAPAVAEAFATAANDASVEAVGLTEIALADEPTGEASTGQSRPAGTGNSPRA